jgi:hypothetical protein
MNISKGYNFYVQENRSKYSGALYFTFSITTNSFEYKSDRYATYEAVKKAADIKIKEL